MVLVKSDGVALYTASYIQALAEFDRIPATITGTDDDGHLVHFCVLDSHQDSLLTKAIATRPALQHQPTQVSVSIASKTLWLIQFIPLSTSTLLCLIFSPSKLVVNSICQLRTSSMSSTSSIIPLLILKSCRCFRLQAR